mgnify:CR=1 FL=1
MLFSAECKAMNTPSPCICRGFWNIEFDELDFLSISNSNFAGYTGSKNLVQTRQKFQLIKLDFTNSIFQNPSADRYRVWLLNSGENSDGLDSLNNTMKTAINDIDNVNMDIYKVNNTLNNTSISMDNLIDTIGEINMTLQDTALKVDTLNTSMGTY